MTDSTTNHQDGHKARAVQKLQTQLATYDSIKAALNPVANSYAGKTIQEAFWFACELGDLNKVKDYHRQGANIGAYDDDAVREAANNGRLDIVKYLHKNGANIRAYDDDAMRWATASGHLEVVKYLHNCGADINVNNGYPMEWAAAGGHLEVVKYLHKNGADIRVNSDIALRRAATHGHLEVVKYLHKNGADIRVNSDEALLHAAYNNHLEVTKYLLEHGAALSRLLTGKRQLLEFYRAACERWQKVLRMDMPSGLEDENPALFKGAAFNLAHAILRKEGYCKNECNRYAFQAAALLQTPERILQYLKQWGETGRQPLHDLIQMVKVPRQGPFNAKDWGDAVLKCGPAMAKLVKFADRVPTPLKSSDGKTWSSVNTRAECVKYAFKDAAKYPDLAKICIDHVLDEDEINEALEVVNKTKPHEKNIPDIAIDGDKFDMPGARFYCLPAHDVRGLFLGLETGCCQHINGAGSECAEHGYTSPEGGFYVIAQGNGRIIGQAWAWRGKQGELCLDSLEQRADQMNSGHWQKILKAFGDELTRKNDKSVTALHVGTGGSTPATELSAIFTVRAKATPKDYTGYRDSKGPQIVAWRARQL